MKEFKLPENWAVRSNDEIDHILCKWRGGGHTLSPSENIMTHKKYWESVSSIGSYTEITFEQFKKYVLKEPEENNLPLDEWIESEKAIKILEKARKEYPEGTKFFDIRTNKSCEVKDSPEQSFWWCKLSSSGEFAIANSHGGYVYHSLIDEWANIISKPIEKWSVGTYVVILNSSGGVILPEGSVAKIYEYKGDIIKLETIETNPKKDFLCIQREESPICQIKWFATKKEAEDYSKEHLERSEEEENLIELDKFPDNGHCVTNRVELRNYLKNKYPNITTEWKDNYSIVSWNSNGYWFCISKSLKYRYTYEQLEKFFITKELEEKPKELPFKVGDIFNVYSQPRTWNNYLGGKCPLSLSFPMLSRRVVKIEKTVNGVVIYDGEYGWDYYPELFKKQEPPEYTVGAWYMVRNWAIKFKKIGRNVLYGSICINTISGFSTEGGIHLKSDIPVLMNDLSGIQKYLPDGHVDKIKGSKFKPGDRVLAIGNIQKFSEPTVGILVSYVDSSEFDSRVDFDGSVICANVIGYASDKKIEESPNLIDKKLKTIKTYEELEEDMVNIVKFKKVELLNIED
jgi:hypothetical protein